MLDPEQFLFPVSKTTMDGVYCATPSMAGLDLSADAATLRSHGLFLPRPESGDHPALIAAWKRLSEGNFLATPPGLADAPLRQPAQAAHAAGATRLEPLWSGCELQGEGGWQSCTGLYTVPYQRDPAGAAPGHYEVLSGWVGLGGGPGEPEFLQIGISTDADNWSSPTIEQVAFPWLEWWGPPLGSQPALRMRFTDGPVPKPGDLVQMHVGYGTSGGSIHGIAQFLFIDDLVKGEVVEEQTATTSTTLSVNTPGSKPFILTCLIDAPTADPKGSAPMADWVLEHQDQGTTPEFSSTPGNTHEPVRFTKAKAETTDGRVGYPDEGTVVLWQDIEDDGKQLAGLKVTLKKTSVSIEYDPT